MIKHIVFIVLLGIVTFFSGVFIINSNEVGVVVTQSAKQIYKPGTHWKVPFYGQLIVVYQTERNDEITTPIIVSLDNDKYNVNLAYDWHVVDNVKYVSFTENTDKSYQVISDNVRSIYAKESNLSAFSNMFGINYVKQNFESMGIVIDKVYITNISKIDANDSNPSVVAPNVTSYNNAMKIKADTDSSIEAVQQKMMNSDPKFYKLYSYLKSIQQTATSKESVESLDAILQTINN